MKILTMYSFCFVLLFLFACAKPAQLDEAKGETFLRAIIEEQPELLNIASFEIAAMDAVRLVEAENPYIGLRLYPGLPMVNSGERTEISFDYPFEQGDTIVYKWRIMFKDDFSMAEESKRWWLISQWHDQPDIRKNESWEDFPAHSPPIALSYGILNGEEKLGFHYGVDSLDRVGMIPLIRDQWIDIRVEIHWSEGQDGSAAFYLDNASVPLFSAEGANMYNDYQHYFKIGQYRHPDFDTDNTVYFDNIRIYKK